MTELKVTVDDFQADCLRLIDEVASTQIPLTITRDGEPLVRLLPAAPAARRAGSAG
jgi:prevent-host-death family protein